MSYSKRGEAKFIQRGCKNCESIMILPQWITKKYCSKECFTAFHRAKWINIVCQQCATVFAVNPSRQFRSRFCSLSCHGKYFSGEKSCHYKKDRGTLAKRQERNDGAYSEWRRNVWKRDGFRCKIRNLDCEGRIEAHHILSWSEYVELRYETNNGITLCHAHHPRKRAEEKRLAPIFTELVAVSKKEI